MRVTRLFLEECLQIVCKSVGKKFGRVEGGWDLNHNAVYGGYIVVQYGKNGSTSFPLLNERISGKEMCYALEMAIRVLEMRGE